MYAFFEKRGKAFVAIIMAVLAVAFLLPAGFGGGRGGGAARLGTVDGKPVDANEVQAALNVVQSCDRVLVPVQDPSGQGGQQLTPLPAAMFGESLYRQIQQNPVQLYLLMREARDAGAVPPESEIDRLFVAPVQYNYNNKPTPMAEVTPAVKDQLRNDLRQLIGIRVYFGRSRAVMKVSEPLLDDAIARAQQQVKVRVASFDAADYEKAVAAPSADELTRQFDAYKNIAPGATADNPFGFGYQVPVRLGVQWMVVPDAEVEKAVVASKPEGRWEEQAIIYYREHKSEFPTTQSASATQPTPKSYAEARVDVLKALRDPLVQQKKREVAARVSQQMQAVYQKAPATTGPSTQPAGYGFDDLRTIADAVQKQTGVRPTAVAPAGPFSQDELTRQPGFGQSLLVESQMNFTTGPAYLFDRLKPLHKNADTANSLGLGQPTPALLGNDGLYVARAVSVEPAHAPAFDDVKPMVERDVRRSHAFDTAATAAQTLLDKANSAGGLNKTDAKFQTSDWFGATGAAPSGLTGKWAASVINPAFDALRGLASPAALPVRTLAKLRGDGVAAVIEVFDVKTTLTTSDLAMARAQAEQTVAGDVAPRDSLMQWFDFDSVAKRTGYKPAETPKHDGPADPRNPQSPNNPGNPLLPG